MDNLKKFQIHQRGKAKNVDGIIGGNSRVRNSNFRRPKSYLPEASPIGDFKRAEGFQPFKQSNVGTEPTQLGKLPLSVGAGQVTDLPATPASKQKRRWFHRRQAKKPVSWLKRVGQGAGIIFALIALTGGFLFAKGYINLHKIFKGGAPEAPALQKNVDPTLLKGEGDGRINILVLGKGGPGHDGPDLTDSMLIASIDPVNNKAALLSVPRDLYTPTTSNTKINSVYAEAKQKALYEKESADQAEVAGLSAADSIISKDMGIPIQYHIMVDFKAFQQAIDTVGGVDVNVTKPLYDTLWLEDTGKNYTINLKPGVIHMDGREALVFSRSRETSTRGDFDRTERQREVIVALKSKVFSIGTFSNPVKISQLISAFGSHVEANMNVNEILRLYDITKTISNTQVASVGLADPPNNYVTTANINGESVVVPSAGSTNFSAIQSYVRNTLKDGYIAKENANIAVLNGTTIPGLATTKASELKSYGYNVTQVADAPSKNYPQTLLVDLRNGAKKYTRHYLEQRFSVSAITKLPDTTINPGNADFVIILGQNESTTQ